MRGRGRDNSNIKRDKMEVIKKEKTNMCNLKVYRQKNNKYVM
jgi:hypothetical protein